MATSKQPREARRPRRVRRPTRDNVRRRLLEAAAEMLEARGLDQATLEEIAEAAGFSKGAVYSNFKGKDDLLLALVRQRVAERIAVVGRARSGAAGRKQQLRATSRSLVRFLKEDPAWHRLFLDFWLRATRDPHLHDEFALQRRAMRELVAREIEGIASVLQMKLPVASSVVATIVLALSNGVAIEHIADPASVPADTLAVALDLVWRGLEAQRK